MAKANNAQSRALAQEQGFAVSNLEGSEKIEALAEIQGVTPEELVKEEGTNQAAVYEAVRGFKEPTSILRKVSYPLYGLTVWYDTGLPSEVRKNIPDPTDQDAYCKWLASFIKRIDGWQFYSGTDDPDDAPVEVPVPTPKDVATYKPLITFMAGMGAWLTNEGYRQALGIAVGPNS